MAQSHVCALSAAQQGKGRNGRQHSLTKRRQRGQPHAGQGQHADSRFSSGVFFFPMEVLVEQLPDRRRCVQPGDSQPLVSATNKWDTAKSRNDEQYQRQNSRTELNGVKLLKHLVDPHMFEVVATFGRQQRKDNGSGHSQLSTKATQNCSDPSSAHWWRRRENGRKRFEVSEVLRFSGATKASVMSVCVPWSSSTW